MIFSATRPSPILLSHQKVLVVDHSQGVLDIVTDSLSNAGYSVISQACGAGVPDASVHGLALEMKRGNVTVIEDVPLFDRAIGTITEQLHSDGEQVH
jgi:hypothetical protein